MSNEITEVLDENEASLNVAAWTERSVVNGPGERFVLWVQGCPFRCPGCFNQTFLPVVEARRFKVEEVAAMVRQVSGIEGITFSGGEPMLQAQSLYYLSRTLRAEGLTVLSYSGYRLEELVAMRNPWVHKFLDCLDVLIDGRYEEAQQGALPWRGSSNQRVHFLTEAYHHLEAQVNEARRLVEFIVGNKQFVSTGIFNPEFVRRLEEALKESMD